MNDLRREEYQLKNARMKHDQEVRKFEKHKEDTLTELKEKQRMFEDEEKKRLEQLREMKENLEYTQ